MSNALGVAAKNAPTLETRMPINRIARKTCGKRMRYYMQRNDHGEGYWYLLGDNHEHLASPGRSYPTKEDCYRVINLVKSSVDVELQEV